MAIAGPAASVGLAALAGAAALLAHDALLPIELFGGSLLVGLFWFNLIIAAFNLLPAFPLDGGRVFRALLERRYDLERATRLAARIGRGVAIVLILTGVFFDLVALHHRRVRVLRRIGGGGRDDRARALGRAARLRRDVARTRHRLLRRRAPTSSGRCSGAVRSAPFRSSALSGYEGMVEARAIEHSAPEQRAIDLAERSAPGIAATDGLEDNLPLVASTPARGARGDRPWSSRRAAAARRRPAPVAEDAFRDACPRPDGDAVRREHARHSDGAGAARRFGARRAALASGGAAGRADGRGSCPHDHCVGRHQNRDGAEVPRRAHRARSSGTREPLVVLDREAPDAILTAAARTWSPRVHDDAWARRRDECRTRKRRRGRRTRCERSRRADGTWDAVRLGTARIADRARRFRRLCARDARVSAPPAISPQHSARVSA